MAKATYYNPEKMEMVESEREYRQEEYGVREYDWGGYSDTTLTVYIDEATGIMVKDLATYEAFMKRNRLS